MNAIDEIEALAVANPERQSVCRYAVVHKDGEIKPECIVGHWMAAKGVPLEALVVINEKTFLDTDGDPLGHAAGDLLDATSRDILYEAADENVEGAIKALDVLPKLTMDEIVFIANVQREQDNGCTWSEAVKRAFETT